MSRPESEFPISYTTEQSEVKFKIAHEEGKSTSELRSLALPFELRQEALRDFDSHLGSSKKSETLEPNTEKLAKRPEIHDVLVNAIRLQNEGEVQLAKNLFRSALRVESNNAAAVKGLAHCCKSLGQEEEALQVLRAIVDQETSGASLLMLADTLYEVGYNEEALSNYFKAISEYIEDSKLLFHIFKNMGNIFLRLGDPNGAEEYYNKAYTLNPDSDLLRVNFGSLALFRGELDKAIARFREAVQLNDKNDKAWAGLAIIHREFGDAELAWANIEKALDLAPTNESAIRLVCEWAMKDNEIEKAISRLKAYLAFKNEDVFCFTMLAKFYYFAGDLSAALVEIEKAIALSPDQQEANQIFEIINEELLKKEIPLKNK